MIAGLDSKELVELALLLIAVGALSGFLAGLFGIGGGAILVPFLYEAFAAVGTERTVLMHVCLGTALAVMVPTSWTSFQSHKAKGAVDTAFLRRVGVWIVAGVLLGAVVARFAPSRTLQLVWAVLGALLSLKMALGREDWRIADDVPRTAVVEVVSFLIGFVSTLMSIGGASLMITFLSLYGRALLPSIATSSGLGPLIAIPGTLGFIWAGWGTPGLPPLSLGYVSVIGALIIIPASVLAAPIGVRVSHGTPRRRLEIAFSAFLGTMSLKFFWDVLMR